ncbi:MAG: PAS domain-containing sensor histidine kinase [Parvibaculaceae bacterium]|nr:PAS domain-containing sensor histidine kinase [Parvibaculaceae bacterium]
MQHAQTSLANPRITPEPTGLGTADLRFDQNQDTGTPDRISKAIHDLAHIDVAVVSASDSLWHGLTAVCESDDGQMGLTQIKPSAGLGALLAPGPDILLIDMSMQGQAGCADRAFLQRVLDLGPALPVLALLPATTTAADIYEIMRSGVDEHMVLAPSGTASSNDFINLLWRLRGTAERAQIGSRPSLSPSHAIGPGAVQTPHATTPPLTLVQEAPEAMVILDHEGNVTFMNVAAEELIGRSLSQMMGKPFDVGLDPTNQSTEDDDNAQNVTFTDAMGQTRFAEMRLTDSEHQGVTARIATLTDVSVRKTLEATISQAKAASSEVTKRSHRFFSNVNHDLRTPLTHIIGFAELMKDERFGPLGQERYRSYAQDIHESGQTLLDMVEDLLSIADTDQNNQHDEICLLPSLMDITLNSQLAVAQKAGVRFTLDEQTPLPGMRANSQKIRQGFYRLIAELIHALPSDTHVRVAMMWDEQAGFVIQSKCIPAGSDAQLPLLALLPVEVAHTEDAFLSAEKSGAPREDGLALSLTRKVVEMHDGALDIRQDGHGHPEITIRFPASRHVR